MLDLHWWALVLCVDNFVRLNQYKFSILNIRSTFVAMSKKLNTSERNENCEKRPYQIKKEKRKKRKRLIVCVLFTQTKK